MTSETKESFITEMEKQLTEINNRDDIDVNTMEELMTKTSKKEMEVTIKRKIRKDNKDETEPIWFNKEIKKEISKRRNINKLRRKAKTEQERAMYEEQHLDQKLKVKFMVREAINKHEKKLTEEILRDPNRNKNLWKHINRLKGKDLGKTKNVKIYNEMGQLIPVEETPERILQVWEKIYQSNANNIREVWNPEEVAAYKYHLETIQKEKSTTGSLTFISNTNILNEHHDMAQTTYNFPYQLEEHFDMAIQTLQRHIHPMKPQMITKEEVTQQLKKTKNGKAPGLNGLKPDLYTAMLSSDLCIDVLTKSLNKVILENNLPRDWKKSKTNLIEKKTKPTEKDLRPIALMNSSYKIYMGIIRTKIENHLKNNNLMNELQSGSTEKRRTTDNLFVLKYCIDENYRNKKPLRVISIDFKKAFDSINRKRMIEQLKKYKIDYRIIETIASIYTGDSTKLFLNNEEQVEVEVTSGIRQGCNGSTTLFLLITYYIIAKLQNKDMGFVNDLCSISSLFYVDDGLLLANSVNEAHNMIKTVITASEECGLQINKDKCGILIYNLKENRPVEVGGIKVVSKIKYLGVTVTDDRDCFKEHKEECVLKAMKMVNNLYAILGNCCNRLLIGKTFWKGLAMPGFMYASEVMYFTKQELNNLQKINNQAHRYMLQVPIYTACEALRGEVGASTTVSRDMKNKLLFVKHALDDNTNELLKKIMAEQLDKMDTKWIKQVWNYLDILGITPQILTLMKENKIKKLIDKWDTRMWQEEMKEKSTLKIYREYKQQINEENWLDNREESNIMIKARVNALKLGWRENLTKKDETKCQLCKKDIETLNHFILHCDKLNPIRQKNKTLQRPYQENEEAIIAEILLFYKPDTYTREANLKTLYAMWKERVRILKLESDS